MTTDALDTLGTLDEPPGEKRDAIHLAVIHVQAGEDLCAGDWVFIDDEGQARETDGPENAIGVVDPFLYNDTDCEIEPGDWFWLVIKPRVITSLRHVWTHPDIDGEVTESSRAHVDRIDRRHRQTESEIWLRNYASEVGIAYEHLIAALTNGEINPEGFDHDGYGTGWYSDGGGSYLTIRGVVTGGNISPDAWYHLATVTGYVVPQENRPAYFSCSC